MKKGTKVILIDGSYSMKIADNQIQYTGNIIKSKVSRDGDGDFIKYEVVETGLKLPYDGRFSGREHNDTIIKNIETGEIIFTTERFLKEIAQPVPFLEAVKAYSEGKAIRCEWCGLKTIYKKHNGDLLDDEGDVLCAKEILSGEWFIGDPT